MAKANKAQKDTSKTLTLKKDDQPKMAETNPADRYFSARESLRPPLQTLCAATCPGHEVKMTETILNGIDEIIDAALTLRFEKEFGDNPQQPVNPT